MITFLLTFLLFTTAPSADIPSFCDEVIAFDEDTTDVRELFDAWSKANKSEVPSITSSSLMRIYRISDNGEKHYQQLSQDSVSTGEKRLYFLMQSFFFKVRHLAIYAFKYQQNPKEVYRKGFIQKAVSSEKQYQQILKNPLYLQCKEEQR